MINLSGYLETTWPDRARSPGRGICSARSEMRPGPPRFVGDLAILVVLSTWQMPCPFHIRSFIIKHMAESS